MTYSQISLQRATNAFLIKVYGWMFIALCISGITAFYSAQSPRFITLLMTSPLLLLGLLLAQIGLVVVLAGFLRTLTFTTGLTLFLLYAFLSGLTLSSIFLVYTASSITAALLITAGMFGAMSLYGYSTSSDLSSMRSFLVMGLVGIIIAMVVNMFLQNQLFDLIIAACAVLIFTLLTAYDTQRLKELAQQTLLDEEAANKYTIIGALTLYLDFINLFLSLLRLLGKRRRD